MKNAVIYARFSSQGQNEQSIESQIRICRDDNKQRVLVEQPSALNNLK